jgi:hypothetical protein
MWAKAVVVWGVTRPGSETCKTKPIGGPGAPRLRIGDCGLRTEKRRPGTAGKGVRAKRTQFGPAGGQMRKTKPIWPARPGMGAGRRAAMPRRSAIVQNEPNSGTVSGLKSQVSSRRGQTRHALTSNFTLQTSHFKLQTPRPTTPWVGFFELRREVWYNRGLGGNGIPGQKR